MSRNGSYGSDYTTDVGTGQVSRNGSDGSNSTADVGTGQVSRGFADDPASAANVAYGQDVQIVLYVLDQLNQRIKHGLNSHTFSFSSFSNEDFCCATCILIPENQYF